MNNGFEVEQSPFKYLVDYNEVEFLGLGQLFRGVFEAHFDDVRRILAPALQSRTQLFPAGGRMKISTALAYMRLICKAPW